jgi:hypothetical protein
MAETDFGYSAGKNSQFGVFDVVVGTRCTLINDLSLT